MLLLVPEISLSRIQPCDHAHQKEPGLLYCARGGGGRRDGGEKYGTYFTQKKKKDNNILATNFLDDTSTVCLYSIFLRIFFFLALVQTPEDALHY